MTQAQKIRIMVAKVGCDIHERGALTMINVFRDEGMEVIYTGRYQTEAAVANAAVNEDVDIIGVSDLSGNLPGICRKILKELNRLDSDIPLFCGGAWSSSSAAASARRCRPNPPACCATGSCWRRWV